MADSYMSTFFSTASSEAVYFEKAMVTLMFMSTEWAKEQPKTT